MTQFESEFDQVFKGKGGRYNDRSTEMEYLNWVPICSRILVEWMRHNDPFLPEPYIDIIDDNEPNAYVTKNGDKYFIGITYGTIVLLNNTFYDMLSSKIFLTDIRDPAKEVDTKEMLLIRLTKMGQFMLTKDLPEKPVPINHIRILFAFQLMKMAVEFLVLHEFAHIIYGHLDFVRSVLGSFEVKEIEEKKESRNCTDPLIWQSLEMNADSYAAKRSIDILEILISNPDALGPELRPYLNEWPSALRMWVYSTYTFFRLFSNQNNTTGIRNGFHPPPSIRSHLILAVAYSVLGDRIGTHSSENLSKICMDAIVEVEGFFEEISQKEVGFTYLNFMIEEEVFAHSLLLLKNWKNVEFMLQPFTYLPLTL